MGVAVDKKVLGSPWGFRCAAAVGAWSRNRAAVVMEERVGMEAAEVEVATVVDRKHRTTMKVRTTSVAWGWTVVVVRRILLQTRTTMMMVVAAMAPRKAVALVVGLALVVQTGRPH
jgi:hypothetical protein